MNSRQFIHKRGPLPNLSTFAFTATPKAKTLELFGVQRADGKFEPFHLYGMRQAIEEEFILDVLANYTDDGPARGGLLRAERAGDGEADAGECWEVC